MTNILIKPLIRQTTTSLISKRLCMTFAGFVLMAAIPAIAEPVTSLRGNADIEETNGAPDVNQLDTSGRFTKNYRQQPPLIPHKIRKYEIDKKNNQCLRCHDWPQNVEENAPKISETHYTDRDGKALDQVAKRRWFCTQCHVPQFQAPSLVGNTFKPRDANH